MADGHVHAQVDEGGTPVRLVHRASARLSQALVLALLGFRGEGRDQGAAAQDEVSKLIEQLGAETIEQRQAAEERLLELGAAAETALTKACESSDAEIAVRVKFLLERIRVAREEKEILRRVQALPKTFGECAFVCYRDGRRIGTGILKTREQDGKILLEDTLEPAEGQGLHPEHVKQSCRADRFLSVCSIELVYEGGLVQNAEVKDGVMASPRGTTKLSERVVERHALYRVVTLLPPKRESSMAIDLLEGEDFRVRAGCTLTCVGEEELSVDRKNVTAWRWDLRDEKNRIHSFWVGGGVLLKARTSNGMEVVFAVK